ncbi:GPP34 family phosphoprotein [Streptomyces sp. NPDC052020]|uniref:GOLPH3/VPS74 family protein n=1 Tax=Streptomyces sp. NPDC052020 TaxID=3155677 RepID=UPI00343B25C3
MSVTLGEEIMLLSLDDASGEAKDRLSAGWGVASGTLLELVLAGRVTVEDGLLEVADPSPTGTPLLDERLEKIVEWAGPSPRAGGGKTRRKAQDWLTKDQVKAVEATVRSLLDRGLVREEKHRVLGLFPVRRYPEADGAVERELRERLTAVVLEGERPDDRTTGLVALLDAAELHRIAFPGLSRKELAERVKPRMAEIAEGHRVGDSLREAIRSMRTVMMVVASTTAATTTIAATG